VVRVDRYSYNLDRCGKELFQGGYLELTMSYDKDLGPEM